MINTATFQLLRNGNPILSVELGDDPVQLAHIVDVSESQDYGLEVINREADTEYQIRIGDISADDCGDKGPNRPRPRGRSVDWYDARFFDGAYGMVSLRVLSRPTGTSDWYERAVVSTYVSSSKLTTQRYETMVGQLRMLAANIIFDLVSKTLRSIAIDSASRTPFVRTSLIELRVIQKMWPSLAACLDLMQSQPAKRIQRIYETRTCYVGEKLDARSLEGISSLGINPTRTRLASFNVPAPRLIESTNVPENQMVKAFLVHLLHRIRHCQAAIEQQIQGLEDHRRWRTTRRQNTPSLYEMEDLPKIARLKSYQESANRTCSQVRYSLSMPFLNSVVSKSEIVSSPIMQHVVPYRAFLQILLQYRKTGILILDEPEKERMKSTHRLYEQWVFLQLVSAIHGLGLPCTEQEGLLNRTRAYRFTLDFDRGARVVFDAGSGRYLSVRYEPWILPKDHALNSQDSVYRGGTNSVAWSPDILVELFPASSDATAPNCSYAVVIDAKYTARINDDHWDSVGKYHQIRATSNDRQVGRQLWLAYPGQPTDDDAFPIIPRDSSVNWTDEGPDCRQDENVEGTVLLRPARSRVVDTESTSWFGKPESAAIEFVDGLLSYLGIEHKKPISSAPRNSHRFREER